MEALLMTTGWYEFGCTRCLGNVFSSIGCLYYLVFGLSVEEHHCFFISIIITFRGSNNIHIAGEWQTYICRIKIYDSVFFFYFFHSTTSFGLVMLNMRVFSSLLYIEEGKMRECFVEARQKESARKHCLRTYDSRGDRKSGGGSLFTWVIG